MGGSCSFHVVECDQLYYSVLLRVVQDLVLDDGFLPAEQRKKVVVVGGRQTDSCQGSALMRKGFGCNRLWSDKYIAIPEEYAERTHDGMSLALLSVNGVVRPPVFAGVVQRCLQ